jgi:hypothetical protein
MIWAFLVLLVLTVLIHLGIPRISKRYGPAVEARFVERLKPIPGQGDDSLLNAANLGKWIRDNPDSARGYASPILFPLDFLFMLTLGGALACGSVFLARHAMLVSGFPPAIWLIIPLVYVAADFVEDTLLIGIFRDSTRLTDQAFLRLARTTRIKIISVCAGFLVFGALLVLAIARCYFKSPG